MSILSDLKLAKDRLEGGWIQGIMFTYPPTVNAFCFSFIAFVGGIITIICAVGLFQFTVFLFF